MKKLIYALLVLLHLSITLTGCYQIDSKSKTDYPDFYKKMSTVIPDTHSMIPNPENVESIDDIYLYYSDYDFIDSYYTIYLECSFSAKNYEKEKQRVIDDAKQYDFTLYNSDSFSYDSVYINQYIEHNSDEFITIQISYALFDNEEYKIIYVDTFEEGIKSELKTLNIPKKYLPTDFGSSLTIDTER